MQSTEANHKTVADDVEQLDKRDARALTEHMDIYRDDPDTTTEEVAVYNKGTRHVVNARARFCDCEDQHYRQPEGGCKHLRRVDFESGRRDIPQWVQPSALDDGLGAAADGGELATDGGQQTESHARITGPHPEFDKYGNYTGSDFWRCSGCGAEAIRRSDLDYCCEAKR
jgi:hypothetical protein